MRVRWPVAYVKLLTGQSIIGVTVTVTQLSLEHAVQPQQAAGWLAALGSYPYSLYDVDDVVQQQVPCK
jgi:hypothetical protein